MIIQYFLMAIYSSILASPVAVILFYLAGQNRSWVPRSCLPNRSLRRFEAAVLLVGISSFGILWLYEGVATFGVPTLLDQAASPTIRAYYSRALIVSVVFSVVALMICWRWSTSVPLAILLFSGLTGNMVLLGQVSGQRMLEWKQRHAQGLIQDEKQRSALIPVKLRFEMTDNLSGADLYINGVYLGKTPYSTTDLELFAKVKPWTQEEETRERDFKNAYLTPKGTRAHRWGWCPIHFVAKSDIAMKMYYRVEMNGVVGYSNLIRQRQEGPSDSSSSIQVIQMDTVFPPWEEALEELLDRARLNDYQVDGEWLKAFNTFGEFATERLEQAAATETHLKKIRELQVTNANHLDEIKDADSAWQKLMEIEARARHSQFYDSGSADGLVVDRLVPLLNPDQLLEHALNLLKHSASPVPLSTSYSPTRFSTPEFASREPGDKVALWPIAHAIWRLDQRLDAESDEESSVSRKDDSQGESPREQDLADSIHPEWDNVIEQRLTPELLRLSYLDPSRLPYASVINGSAYELFLTRSDWRRPPQQNGEDRHIGDFENRVNRWFYELLWLRSPVGKTFRQQQSNAILKLARGALGQQALFMGSLPGDLDFLFLDRGFSKDKPSLAMKFWPELELLTRTAPSSNQQNALRMRWNYLARLWPESTPAMFAQSYEDAISSGVRPFIPPFSENLSASSQFEILRAVMTAEIDRVGKLPTDPGDIRYDGPKRLGEQNISELRNRIEVLPCAESARLLVNALKSDIRHPWWSRLPDFLAYDTDHDDLLQLIAEGQDTSLQLMILPAIEHHPIPTRQRLLDLLLKSTQESVRSKAEAVKRKWAELLMRELPIRTELKK